MWFVVMYFERNIPRVLYIFRKFYASNRDFLFATRKKKLRIIEKYSNFSVFDFWTIISQRYLIMNTFHKCTVILIE